MHVFSHTMKLLTAFLIGSCAGCHVSPATLLWVRWLTWVFGWSLWQASNIATQTL